jgi:hypothetical protein
MLREQEKGEVHLRGIETRVFSPCTDLVEPEQVASHLAEYQIAVECGVGRERFFAGRLEPALQLPETVDVGADRICIATAREAVVIVQTGLGGFRRMEIEVGVEEILDDRV